MSISTEGTVRSAALPAAADIPAGVLSVGSVAVSVPLRELRPGRTPRLAGIDRGHVEALASVEVPLPPILVRASDMTVVDGRHRLLAARMRGVEEIEVQLFEGTDADAFLRAVEANVAHGLPLSLAERQAAATRIVTSHPHLSDRAIARVSGLSAKAVGAVRRCSTAAEPQLNTRMGQDGRVRPLNVDEGRRRAAQLMTENPGASLREIAREAGISPATVSDVRKRLRAGKPPVAAPPSAYDRGDVPKAQVAEIRSSLHRAAPPKVPATIVGKVVEPLSQGRLPSSLMLEKLRRDPSLKLREDGRDLLRLLQHNALVSWPELGAVVPRHCEVLVSRLARENAARWLELAQRLEARTGAAPHQSLQQETCDSMRAGV